MTELLRQAWATRIEAADEVKRLAQPVRCRILHDRPEWMGVPGEFAKYNPDTTQVPAGTEGLVIAWHSGETVPVWQSGGNVKVKSADSFLVQFPSKTIVLMEDEIELLEPIPRRKIGFLGDRVDY